MAKKCKCPPPGAPDWVMTYGDMMSLLLTFFILLAALSELKKEDEFQAIVEQVKKSFGMQGGGGRVAAPDDPKLTLMKRLESVQFLQQRHRQQSNADDPGIEGRQREVTKVREGMKFVVGGRITFEPGSAELTEYAKRQLDAVASQMRGLNNKLELRGHAAAMELVDNDQAKFRNLWDLSYARARSVMEYLTSPELGIRAERVRLIANADREPLEKRVYTADEQEPNRRVEVLVSESLVKDFTTPEGMSSR
jgi:chemotaxis protein MotB